jgi:hypothetical protein
MVADYNPYYTPEDGRNKVEDESLLGYNAV